MQAPHCSIQQMFIGHLPRARRRPVRQGFSMERNTDKVFCFHGACILVGRAENLLVNEIFSK